VFTEFRVPLLKEKTAAQELTLNLAARYADYNGATGGVLAYNGGLEYAPIEGLRFRAGHRARGACTQPRRPVRGAGAELRSGTARSVLIRQPRQRFADARGQLRGGGEFPRTITTSTRRRSRSSAAAIPELKEETSDSFTRRPSCGSRRFLQGFSLSADYFDINIDDVITAPDGAGHHERLLRRAGPEQPVLRPVHAQTVRASARNGEAAHQIIQGSLQQLSLNYASSTARGVDIEAGYSHQLGEVGKLSTRLVWTHMLQRDDFLNPAAPGDADQVLLELGDPKDAFNLSTDFAMGRLTIGYQLRYIGKQVLNFYEDTFSVQGNPPQNQDYADVRYYGAVLYHDIRAAYDITDKVNAYLGVDNATNRIPPFGLTGTGAGSGIYEAKGRFAYAGVKVAF